MSAQAIVSTSAKVINAQAMSSQNSKSENVESNFGDLLSNNLKTTDSSKATVNSKKNNGPDLTPEAKVNRQMTKNTENPSRDETVESTSNTSKTEKPVDSNDAATITKLTDSIKSIVKETLQIDDEELAFLMGSLGFTMVDLLNQDNLKQLCMAQAGTKDVMGLVTNESLANQFSALTQAIAGIELDEFGIDKAQLDALVEQVKSDISSGNLEVQPEAVNSTQILNQNTTEIIENDNSVMSGKTTGKESNTPQLTDTDSEIRVYVEKTVKDVESGKSSTMEQNANNQASEDMLSDSDMNNPAKEIGIQKGNSEKPVESTVEQIVRNLVVSTTQNANGVEVQHVEVTQIRDIVMQIVREIRVNIKPDLTSMELQLNPENLGRVNLSVASKEGLMTAQFTVTNMVAKEAIESQIQLLKDNLNQQGVKVESIEVTVSNFGFSQGNETAKENQNQNRNARRFSGELMEELDTFDETMKEDIRIMNGNTVDYSA